MATAIECRGDEEHQQKLLGSGPKGFTPPATAAVAVSQISTEEISCLKQLRKQIKEDEFVRDTGVSEDEEFLLAFIRGKRYNVTKAFNTLRNHIHVVKEKYPQYFENLVPQDLLYLRDPNIAPRLGGLLKYPDQGGRIVSIGKAAPFDPKIHRIDDLIKVSIIWGMELLRTENAPRNGLVMIVDAGGFGFRHAREFSVSRMFFFLSVFLGAYPISYQGLHVLNNGRIFDTILTFVKKFLPKKLRERIHLHGNDFSSLHQHVPREILPESVGGLLKDEEAYDLDFEMRPLQREDYYKSFGYKS